MKRASFRLDRRLAPARALRQAALAQAEIALAGVARGDARGIHDARKACKRLRAVLRLVRPQLGASFRLENRALRDAGRALAGGREAVVLVQTARDLARRDATLKPLPALLRTAATPPGRASLADARRRLLAERERVALWPLEDLSIGALLAGLLAGYERARREWREARRAGTAEALHEWRKQVKHHGYQGELLAPLWPELARRARRVDRLGEALGWHHDLEMLSQSLGRRRAAVGEALRQRAQRRVGEAQARAERQALALGARLFAEKPLQWLRAHTA